MRHALRCSHQQALGQRLEIEPAIKPVGKSSQILLSILCKSKAVVAATQAGFEITQHRVDPLQLRDILGLASRDNGAVMGAAGLRHRIKTSQPVRIDDAARSQTLARPLCDGFELESTHQTELDAHGVTFIRERDSSYKGDLVFRATPDLATHALASQISIVDLDFSTERIAGLPLGHGLHQFVMHQPCRWVAHPQMALERECRDARFGLTDEIDCQKPGHQRQFGALKNGARNQRGLMPTGIALEDFVGTMAQDAVCSAPALGAAKTIRPARTLQGLRAKRLSAEKVQELRQRQAGLELNAIHGHGTALKKSTMGSDYAFPGSSGEIC